MKISNNSSNIVNNNNNEVSRGECEKMLTAEKKTKDVESRHCNSEQDEGEGASEEKMKISSISHVVHKQGGRKQAESADRRSKAILTENLLHRLKARVKDKDQKEEGLRKTLQKKKNLPKLSLTLMLKATISMLRATREGNLRRR